MSVSYR